MEIHLQKLDGHWTDGYALDFHTTSSKPTEKKTIKKIVDGKEIEKEVQLYETTRPEIAEHLFQLKYRSDRNHIEPIAKEATKFLSTKTQWDLHKIIPIPPSDDKRKFQPVYEFAQAIGKLCNIEVDYKTLMKLKTTSELKEIEDPDKRREILKDAFGIVSNSLNGKNVLLFDDLYRSGETLNAVCDIIKNKGNAKNIYVLTITKTRSKR
jgi:predicted amidophosphoribosyltransferase